VPVSGWDIPRGGVSGVEHAIEVWRQVDGQWVIVRETVEHL